MRLPSEERALTQFAGIAAISFFGAALSRLYPGWPWLFICAGVIAALIAGSIPPNDFSGADKRDTVLISLMAAVIFYFGGLVLAALGIEFFGLAISLLGWEDGE